MPALHRARGKATYISIYYEFAVNLVSVYLRVVQRMGYINYLSNFYHNDISSIAKYYYK